MEYQNKTITLKDGRTALLRAVCKEDAVPMIAYMKACYEQTPYLMRYPDEFAVTAEQEATYLERQLVSPDVLMLVCEVEGKLAGNCQLDLNRWRKTRHRGQVAIALLKDYWGLGIGTAMFEEMIEKARQEKLEQLELEVIEGNQRAIGLYHKMGFVCTGEKPNAIRLEDATAMGMCCASSHVRISSSPGFLGGGA